MAPFIVFSLYMHIKSQKLWNKSETVPYCIMGR